MFTYRVGGHSTADDPSRYRPADEAQHWPLGDPVARLKAHLIKLGAWSEDRHKALAAELEELVLKTDKEAQAHGVVADGPHQDPKTMFEDVFSEMPWHLREQQEEYLRLRNGKDEGSH